MIRKKTPLMTAAAALIAVLAALLMAIPLMSTRSAAAEEFEFVTGINDDGSLKTKSMSYISISTYEDFKKINESDESLAGNHVLENDITLSGGWEPLGMDADYPFTGCFDGNGYAIKGLNVNNPGSYRGFGLFGYVTGSVLNVMFRAALV